MGNKQSTCPSEAEEPAEPAVTRLPPTGRRLKEAGDLAEDGDDGEVAEVPPPMRPISSMPAPDDSSLKKVSLPPFIRYLFSSCTIDWVIILGSIFVASSTFF